MEDFLQMLINDCNNFENLAFQVDLFNSFINNEKFMEDIKRQIKENTKLGLDLEEIIVCNIIIGMSLRNRTILEDLQMKNFEMNGTNVLN